ncbi:FAD linked oxidase domain-containing protein [Mycolicibacterium canariasense]|uniref:FAD linked oxidase domain-containing protein n=1 Tax=Mycolicibacterium canariasense TaxID=228230 RepID=A0A100W7N1_MYCCR|nr:FAD-binding oxidoreductase [Mycolicibacterium canariasense]MCV7210989.1 FAD-binding oxidoreductase [Mycolicibacterium canariasense]ORV01405.1 FAD-linked oxidase [Mycolicibacterium canariasense]GAS93132.1 FAD linked oxidase domain-containing protein [Mycolicibacterium canariasense]
MTLADTLGDPGFDNDGLSTLPDHLSALVALPGEPGYERCAPWNVAATVRPAAVVFATAPHHVAEAVRFAAGHGLRVAVQATGHGATAVDTDTILVLTSAMTECMIDVVDRTARVAAGTTWQQVIDAAAPHGLAPLCGSAPGVGVVGFLTGAGVGPLARSVGVSSDYVRSFDVVTGTGELLHATPEQHAELFWGLRGGKATLGIVTSVQIELLPIPEFYGGALYFDGADAPAVLRAWYGWCAGLPENVNTSIALQHLPPLPGVPEPLAGRLTVAVRYAALDDFEEAATLLEPLRAVATPILDTVGVLPYAAIGAVHADPVDPMPVHEDQTLLRELTSEAVDILLAAAGPGSASVQTIVEIRMLGGAYARQAEHSSAFCHRNAAYAVTTIGVPAGATSGLVAAQAGALMRALAPWSTGGLLPNFAPSADPRRMARVYDEQTRGWLADLADRYDPEGVLRTGQVVRSEPQNHL